MKQKFIYYSLLVISVCGIVICPPGILDTMVSIKYELENPGDCISLVNGENLCNTITYLEIGFVVCLALFIGLIYFRTKILKSKSAAG